MEGIRPFDGSPVSPFWEVQEGPSSPIVIDAWRHRQVESRSPVPCGMSQRSLGTLDATLSSIREDVRATSVSVGVLGSGDPRASGVLSEPGNRRLDLIQAAFRRLDVNGHGWVTVQDMVAGLQHFSNMPHNERQRVLFGLCGQGLDPNTRVSIATFVGYYQMLGASIERDRDFEDLLRHHWGFAEVSTILEDMRGKFAMVGLAYAFRKHLEQGLWMLSPASPLSLKMFYVAIMGCLVGMQYSASDLRGVFESLGSGAQSLEVYRLVEHVMRTPAPAAVHHATQATVATGGSRAPGIVRPKTPAVSFAPGRVGAGSGEVSVGKLSAQLPPPTEAPAEGGKMVAASEYGAPLPEAPAEDTHGLLEEMLAPPERDEFGKLPLEDTTEAPPEDDDGLLAPEETDGDHLDEIPEAERQPRHGKWEATSTNSIITAVTTSADGSYGSYGMYSSDGFQQLYQPYSGYAYHLSGLGMAPMAPQHGQHVQISSGQAGQMVASPSHQAAPSPQSSPAKPETGVKLHVAGQRRAVTVGVNYIGTENELRGCINDSDTFITLLTEDFGFSVSDIRQLRDDHPQRPQLWTIAGFNEASLTSTAATRQAADADKKAPKLQKHRNISAALQWLVKGAAAGDHLLFHYSGHGSQRRDSSGDEADGKDETIVPCDFNRSGMIADDELRRMLVDGLPKSCRLTVIMDCCHSGTGMDLSYKARVLHDGSLTIRAVSSRRRHPTGAEVVLLSGCRDVQTSADISGGVAGNKAAGAMTTAFRKVISKKRDISYHHLLLEMRSFLKQHNFDQVPQLCMEFHLNFEEPFLPEADPPVAQPPAPLRSTQRRALTIGINYFSLTPGQGRLSGCINDSETMIAVLKEPWGQVQWVESPSLNGREPSASAPEETFKFEDGQICRLRDDRTNMMPTKANMLSAMRWLTQGVGSGDELFLHYSGHGGRAADRSGDEITGQDDTLIPCDFQTAGSSDDLRRQRDMSNALAYGLRADQ
ncbi:MCA1 [Symbiodinium sp. CCMP2456]|nr:MCA1 [Symbiodinium sp. CCMP2456]